MVALADVGLLSVVTSNKLEEHIAPRYRPDNRWFGVSKRVRAMFVHKDRVADGSLSRYEDMTLPLFRGRVCMRSGLHNYNVGLVAAMWEHQGRDVAMRWLQALRGQLARKPQGNDRAQAKAIYQDVCDVTVMNSYYLGKMYDSAEEEQHAWAQALRLIFPNERGEGSYVSLSAVAIARHSRHRDKAQQFIEFLASHEGQRLLMEENKEYPINDEIALSSFLQSLGRFREVSLDFTRVARRRGDAARMIDALRFDR
ncbi:MAG: extracellular solute-binding protein, partial [Alphaproteobacteria bacterium GM7ARS4]|nr:extracellular solute-binding protein [Alphaproteobacteria bacterium GM7ARS4]